MTANRTPLSLLSLCPEKCAAVDHQGLAGEVASGVRAEELHDGGDVVLRVPLPSDRVVTHELAVGIVVASRRVLTPPAGPANARRDRQ